MKKLNMLPANSVTFEDGCNKYLDNCRQRNLREGTINHYKQSYTQFYKYFDAKMPIEKFTSEMYKQYFIHFQQLLFTEHIINLRTKAPAFQQALLLFNFIYFNRLWLDSLQSAPIADH